MLTKSVSRQEFLDLLQAKEKIERHDLHSADSLFRIYRSSDELHLIWEDEDFLMPPMSGSSQGPIMPRVICIRGGSSRDFLAWVWTYLPEFRPLTAYSRVLEIDDFELLKEVLSKPSLAGLEEACIGLILGEAVTYMDRASEKHTNLTPLTCSSTFSSAMSRMLALSASTPDHFKDRESGSGFDKLVNDWLKARSLTRQRPLKLNIAELTMPWDIVFLLHREAVRHEPERKGVPAYAYRICADLFKTSEVGPESWSFLSQQDSRLIDAGNRMQGPREMRVTFFEDCLPWLANIRREDPKLASFLCGFLASQMGPGTLDYIFLLTPHLDQFPTAIIWYGLCSGLQRRGSLSGFSFGLGRRILREVLREESILDSPRSDIALTELEAMTAYDSASAEFRTGTQGILEIEIAPLVTTTVRWPPKQTEQPEFFQSEMLSLEIRDLSMQLGDLLSKATEVEKRISRLVGSRDLPDFKPGRGRRK